VKPILERFLEKISVSSSGCWEWTAKPEQDGYGRIRVGNKTVKAHRFIYDYYYDDLVKENHVHHVCENKICLNPNHLKQVSLVEHAVIHRKSHCIYGHEFTPENTYLRPQGTGRRCIICRRNQDKLGYRRNKERILRTKF